jgi:uncharacterized membrane protein
VARLRPTLLALATVLASLVAAVGLAAITSLYALDDVALRAARASGLACGVPWGWWFERVAAALVGTLTLGAMAVGGDPAALGRWTITAPRRLALVMAPLWLAPVCLTLDDVGRRPPVVALAVGASVALAVLLRRGAGEPERAGDGWRADAPVFAVMGLHFVTFTWLAVARDRALWSATVDLGIFKEALWHTLHGRVMHSPAVGYSFLGEHFAPVLFVLAPLYALWPTSACLLVVQTAAVSATGYPLYRLARALELPRATATALVAAMLASPPLHTALLYDFHMDLLALPCVAGLALALHRRAWGAACVALAALVSVKEDMFIPALAVLGAALLTGDRQAAKRVVPMAALATGYCLLAILVWMKRFGPPPGVPEYMHDPTLPPGTYKFLRSYRHLVGDGGPLVTLVRHPVRFARYAFSDARLTTFLNFVLPVALLPFAAGRRVVLLAPLAVILLSDNEEIVALHYHYSAIQHPGLYLAAAYGAAAVVARSKRPMRSAQGLAALLVTASIVTLGLHPASVWARTHWRDRRAGTAHSDAVDRLVARVPAAAPVTVTTFVGARTSNRPWSAVFPNGIDRAQWALVDLQRPAWPLDTGVRDEFLRGLMRRGWGAVAWESGALLLRRDGDTSHNGDAIRELFARRRYEVEAIEQTDFPGCVVRDAQASDGWARVVGADDPRVPGRVVYGTGFRLMRGRYRVTFRLRAEPEIDRAEPIGAVDVIRAGDAPLARRELTPEDFPDTAWHDVRVDFEVTTPSTDRVEFRVLTSRRWLLGADEIALSTPDEDAAVRQMLTR